MPRRTAGAPGRSSRGGGAADPRRRRPRAPVVGDVTSDDDVDRAVAETVRDLRRPRHRRRQRRRRLSRLARGYAARGHGAAHGPELHGHVPGGARRAPPPPAHAARQRDHRVVDRRPARPRLGIGLRRHQVRAGRPRREPSRRARGHADQASASSSPSAPRPSSARRWRASRGSTSRARDPGSPPSLWRGRSSRGIARNRVEIYPHRVSKLLSLVSVVWPTLADRVVRRFGRKPVSTPSPT